MHEAAEISAALSSILHERYFVYHEIHGSTHFTRSLAAVDEENFTLTALSF